MKTIDELIEFATDRAIMHTNGAKNILRKYDIIEDEISRLKFNCFIDLRNIYNSIAERLKELKAHEQINNR